MTQAPTKEELLELFTFSVGPHRYAVHLARVDEVLPAAQEPEAMDEAPALLDWLSLRGERIPLVELRRCLPDGEALAGARPGLLVCWLGKRRVAFRIDGVGAVAQVATASLRQPAEDASPAVAAVWEQPPDVHYLLDLRELLRGGSRQLPAAG